MHRYTLAAGYITHNAFAANWVATARAINQQVAGSLDGDRIVVAAKNTAHHAGDSRLRFFGFLLLGQGLAGRRRKLRQHLPRRVFSVPDARHQVVGAAEAIVRGNPQEFFLFQLLQRDAVLARLFFDQLAPNFDGPFTLMNVQPVLDLVP